MRADGVLFDKDGTLFDFSATWDVWAAGTLRDLAAGVPGRLRALADAAGYDLESARFRPQSRVIAGTNREAAECLAPELPHLSIAQIEDHLMRSSAEAQLTPVVALAPLLDALRGLGLRLGVMTNDTEFGARAHLGAAAVADRFDFIAGFDSGFGGKPSPAPLLAFARAQALDPARVVMVGDSRHDLTAGRAAGMQCVGVLTGPATAQDLAPLADAVLPDIGHLPDWLRGADG
ncbi:HAD family hydrolase [Thalassococcus sp. BH17M4-6]|uniref:HAD family hydrolase n=1 Tax=Thalassococcus sp. BH17M4-6 TaxID=3413148 RepID=UPI003BC4A6FB